MTAAIAVCAVTDAMHSSPSLGGCFRAAAMGWAVCVRAFAECWVIVGPNVARAVPGALISSANYADVSELCAALQISVAPVAVRCGVQRVEMSDNKIL